MVVAIVGLFSSPSLAQSETRLSSSPGRTVTFSRDIAPLIYSRCAPCHHSGQSTPFSLVSFADAQKHAQEIAQVVQNGSMPPWLPEKGFGEFLNERRLTTAERSLVGQWIEAGSPEGDPKSAPAPPEWPLGWTLGQPDLVVTMEKPFALGAEGPDVYRNFVVHVPTDQDRFVRAIEFRPGNPKVVHHAFVKLDASSAARRLDGKEEQPGFSGMNVPAEMPDGQFLNWQPGKVAFPSPDGLFWRLPKGSDLVLQVHLNRTGKPEALQSSVGLYFTNQPPSKTAFKLLLVSLALDFAAGASNTVVRDSFTTPADIDVLAILPHAHFLAKTMRADALLPDGRLVPLVSIRQWDFRWQGDYRYERPVHLPRGSLLRLEYTYDNSTNNLRNPNHPPKRVRFGPQSSDEMCELWLQVLLARPSDLELLKQASNDHMHGIFVEAARHQIQVNPADAAAHNQLGLLLWDEAKRQEGWSEIQKAIALDPGLADAHLNKGVFLRLSGHLAEAKQELETVLRLNPGNGRAFGHLGFVYASLGQAKEAENFFLKAVEIDPNDTTVKEALTELRQWQQNHLQGK